MPIRNRIRTLAVGSLLALVTVGLPAIQAEAKAPNPKNDESKFCTITDPSGHIEFYAPGSTVVRNGVGVNCKDGEWQVVGLTGAPGSRVAPLPGAASPTP